MQILTKHWFFWISIVWFQLFRKCLPFFLSCKLPNWPLLNLPIKWILGGEVTRKRSPCYMVWNWSRPDRQVGQSWFTGPCLQLLWGGWGRGGGEEEWLGWRQKLHLFCILYFLSFCISSLTWLSSARPTCRAASGCWTRRAAPTSWLHTLSLPANKYVWNANKYVWDSNKSVWNANKYVWNTNKYKNVQNLLNVSPTYFYYLSLIVNLCRWYSHFLF